MQLIHPSIVLLCVLSLSVLRTVAVYIYREDIALEAVRYASAAYCDADRLMSWDCESCIKFPHMKVLQVFRSRKTGGHAFIGIDTSKHKIVLAFRGTVWTSLGSILDDLKVFHTPFPEGVSGSTVNIGFLSYYLSLQRPIRDELTFILLAHPTFEFWITGHSLGAAVAQIAALDLLDIAPNPIVYTFGTPRVGNYAFAQHYHSLVPRSVRVVHHRDLVTRLPFCSIFGKCKPGRTNPYHTPQEIFYNEDMSSFKRCDAEVGEDPNCSSSFWSSSIKDHMIYFGFEVDDQCKAIVP